MRGQHAVGRLAVAAVVRHAGLERLFSPGCRSFTPSKAPKAELLICRFRMTSDRGQKVKCKLVFADLAFRNNAEDLH